MTENWEIVQGDYGGTYRAKANELDLSDCTAKIYVWRGDTLLIDGKPDASMTVTYNSTNDYSYCDYTVEDEDFPASAIVDDDITQYDVMVRFVKDGFQEHDLGFKWNVHPAPPSA